MQKRWINTLAFASAVLVGASGCASNDEAYVAALRNASNQAESTLADAVRSTEAAGATTVRGELSVSGSFFSVRANANQNLMRFRYEFGGKAIGEEPVGTAAASDCAHAITAEQAIAIAEADQAGTATGISLEMESDDDDVPCTWEVQVLTSSELMEVEVGPNGDVLETEVSDEDGSGEDDDD